MVDGCRSKLVNDVLGVPQGSFWGHLLFFLYTSELFFILENKLIGYADDTTFMAVVPSRGVRVALEESLAIEEAAAVEVAVEEAADTNLKLLDRAVGGARFLTGGVFERGIVYRRSVAVLCML